MSNLIDEVVFVLDLIDKPPIVHSIEHAKPENTLGKRQNKSLL